MENENRRVSVGIFYFGFRNVWNCSAFHFILFWISILIFKVEGFWMRLGYRIVTKFELIWKDLGIWCNFWVRVEVKSNVYIDSFEYSKYSDPDGEDTV